MKANVSVPRWVDPATWTLGIADIEEDREKANGNKRVKRKLNGNHHNKRF